MVLLSHHYGPGPLRGVSHTDTVYLVGFPVIPIVVLKHTVLLEPLLTIERFADISVSQVYHFIPTIAILLC